MQWFGGRESDNVEEGSSSGGGNGLAFGGGIIGFIGLLIYLFTGFNPAQLFSGGQSTSDSTQQQNTRVTNGTEGNQKHFARVVLCGHRRRLGQSFHHYGP